MINKKIDEYGNIIVEGNDAYKLLYMGRMLDFNLTETEDVKLFKNTLEYFSDNFKIKIYKKPDMSEKEFHEERIKEWFIPEEYKNINLREIIYSKISTEEEKNRVDIEINLFEKYSLENVLKMIIYLVDTMKKYNIVWGVGRGSSVASYILYLLGLNKINPLKYNIPIDEFFKENE